MAEEQACIGGLLLGLIWMRSVTRGEAWQSKAVEECSERAFSDLV